MSRPDALHWRNTNHLESLEFTPSRLIYNRVPKWISSLLVLQFALGTVIWCLMRLAPVKELLRSTLGEAWAQGLAGAGGKIETTRFAWLTRILSGDDAAIMLSFMTSQLIAMLLVLFVAMPAIRRTLKRHTGGLKDVFDAIRSMAQGIAPRPITAGRPGESGFLALAFNDMMAKLLANRKELQEANQTLEKKVDARTQELRDAAMKMERMALLDALTGLANRRALIDDGEQKFTAAVRDGTDLICMMIDLDNFKGVNDRLGHAKGDELIKLAADTLRKCCRPYDVSARLGGDEFVLVLALENVNQASQIAQRLQADFRTKVEEMLRGTGIVNMPSMSIGITSRKSAGALNLMQLMAQADTALYQAKAKGKACAQVFLQPAA
jgi:diguanylate cyclase (GGDEF)-like protein